MHLAIYIEDSSGKELLTIWLPKILGTHGHPHTWEIHSYNGIGHIPKNLKTEPDPKKRFLLTQLPKILQGIGKTPGFDAVVVIVDTDRKDCKDFLHELKDLLKGCKPKPKQTLFRLAIEEMEAWYLGDMEALRTAYPNLKKKALARYKPDAICGTWELLANALYPGGIKEFNQHKKVNKVNAGDLKHEWAQKIGPLLDPERNISPSFCKLREGLKKLTTPHGPKLTH
ncbi:MAG: DUF4276 family protein [Gammaproteobacteria bacterium]|nr:DUF4276 family protein [Gammaproteobacteria bacterium]